MAIHIFNCSVDTPDTQPDNVPEDLSYNDMESVAEIVLEKVLDIKDAVAEHDENDSEDGNCFDSKKEIVYYLQTKVENNNFGKRLLIIASTDYDEKYRSQFHPEIVPPPPKA